MIEKILCLFWYLVLGVSTYIMRLLAAELNSASAVNAIGRATCAMHRKVTQTS
jgi:hypothetical protein